MNEFIVWDEDSECFIDEALTVFHDGTLYRNIHDFTNGVSDDLTMLMDIGKTDIEGNKIYADSSIVEFDWQIATTTIEKVKGFFYWNKEKLRYSIRYEKMTNIEKELPFISHEMSNFKIIGTLQENKELLNGK